MPLATINTIWASNTNNKIDFNEKQKATGIEYQGAIVSNELNGIEFLNQTYIDNLQRSATSWNPSKIYKNGDCVIILAQYKNENIILSLKSLKNNNSTAPLQKLDSLNFNINYDLSVVLFAIEDNETDRQISHYLNSTNWIILKNDQIISEQKRALLAEQNLSNEIKNEADRAKLAEQNLKEGLDNEINRAQEVEESLKKTLESSGKEIFLEVKDHVISTAFVGLNYEVDLEAIVEANSNYKKGQFKIKSCEFMPNLTAGSAYMHEDKGEYWGDVEVSANLSFDNNAIKTLYPLFNEKVVGTSTSTLNLTASAAYLAYVYSIYGYQDNSKATAAFYAYCYSYARYATSTASAAFYAHAEGTAKPTNRNPEFTCHAKIKIIYEVWNSDKTIIIDRLTTGAMLFINENQKLLIQNEEENCQSRTMGGTFYFKLEIGQ